MHWIRSLPLETELATDKLSEKSKFIYFLIPLFLTPPSTILSQALPPLLAYSDRNSSVTLIQVAASTITFFIIFLGYRHCFYLYHLRNRKSFIESMVILSFPICIRLFLIFFLIFVAEIFAVHKLPWIFASVFCATSIAFNVTFFHQLRNSIDRLGTRRTEAEQDAAANS